MNKSTTFQYCVQVYKGTIITKSSKIMFAYLFGRRWVDDGVAMPSSIYD